MAGNRPWNSGLVERRECTAAGNPVGMSVLYESWIRGATPPPRPESTRQVLSRVGKNSTIDLSLEK